MAVATIGMFCSMTVDPDEMARFKRTLAKLSPEEIQRRLDGSVIIRAWKRDLAEAEAGRREQEAATRLQNDTADARLRRLDTSRRVWMLVSVVIIAAVALIWTVLPR